MLEKDGGRYPVFVVRVGARVLGYVNSCPHVRLPLNIKDDSFFDVSRSFLFCANHGANFDPDTGLCIRGPCKGQSLKAFPVRVEGEVVIADAV